MEFFDTFADVLCCSNHSLVFTATGLVAFLIVPLFVGAAYLIFTASLTPGRTGRPRCARR